MMLLPSAVPTPPRSVPADPWRVRVTEEDIRHARDAWLRARHGGAPAELVGELRDDLVRLWRARADLGSGVISP